MNKAVFLDKDGTLIDDIRYNVDPRLISISKNSLEGLKLLQENNYLLIIVSNQAGVAYGYFNEDHLIPVKEKLDDLLQKNNISINGFYYCPHHTEGKIAAFTKDCECRKPKPGLLLRAAKELNIDLQQSWMIGDILNDVEAGNKAGCKSILIDNGNETEWLMNKFRAPCEKVHNINEAADYIIRTINYE